MLATCLVSNKNFAVRNECRHVGYERRHVDYQRDRFHNERRHVGYERDRFRYKRYHFTDYSLSIYRIC
jgi:hypothetical protein